MRNEGSGGDRLLHREAQRFDIVKELFQVDLNEIRLTGEAEYLDEFLIGDEIEPRKDRPFRFEIIGHFLLDVFQQFQQTLQPIEQV